MRPILFKQFLLCFAMLLSQMIWALPHSDPEAPHDQNFSLDSGSLKIERSTLSPPVTLPSSGVFNGPSAQGIHCYGSGATMLYSYLYEAVDGACKQFVGFTLPPQKMFVTNLKYYLAGELRSYEIIVHFGTHDDRPLAVNWDMCHFILTSVLDHCKRTKDKGARGSGGESRDIEWHGRRLLGRVDPQYLGGRG